MTAHFCLLMLQRDILDCCRFLQIVARGNVACKRGCIITKAVVSIETGAASVGELYTKM